jgi:NAD(P)-dependent dehydrogenase (short-subunit alcohol dehydrogenase family)
VRLQGKTVIVTGAARGVGRACALAFGREGADLALFDVCDDIDGVPYALGTASQLAHTAEQCRKEGAAVLTAEADIRDVAALRAAVDRVRERFGRVDVLVNNAGIVGPSGKPAHEISEDEWQVMLDINLSGAWRMTSVVGPLLLAQRAGSIINVASTAGLVGYRNFAGYTASKHGLIGLTKATALDYAPLKVRVNALCPGSIRDDSRAEGRMLGQIARALDLPVAESEETFLQSQPMNALIEPEDVAGAALWLASDESAQVTGSVLTVDGGFTAR